MDVTSQQSSDHPVRRPWYARPIAVMNWLALALTIGLLATFLVQAGMLETMMTPAKVTKPKDVTQEKVIVKTSTVKGYDGEQQPYTIDAVSAAQDPDQPNIIGLDQVTGELRKASGQVFTIAADNGVYNSRTRTLDLQNNVVIVSKNVAGRNSGNRHACSAAAREETCVRECVRVLARCLCCSSFSESVVVVVFLFLSEV